MSMTDRPQRPAEAIAFIDLAAQRRRIGPAMEDAILEAIRGGAYILGPQVKQFEDELAAYGGSRHAIGCANGTDAIGMSLLALGLKPGEAVLCPAFTFAATAEVVAWIGGVPIFVDVDPVSFNLTVETLRAGLRAATASGLKVKGVISVDLFGQPADYVEIEGFVAEHGLWLICDAAQSFGASRGGRKVGTFGRVTTTSFFPAKPLGCYGDGGAVLTDDDEITATIRSLRHHGQGSDKYDNVRIGMNSRLDTVQAAVLLEKLRVLPAETAARNEVARRYAAGLGNVVVTPQLADGVVSVWAQYTVRVDPARRADLIARLKDHGIPTAVYYPRPLHLQTAYRRFPVAEGGLPVSERLALEVLSLPMHPYLEPSVQDWIVWAIRHTVVDRDAA